MSHDNGFNKAKINIYMVVIFVGLFILALMPFFFRASKVIKNPSEFNKYKEQRREYVMVEARVRDVSPELLSFIKVGDVQKDQNGEEILKIVSMKIVPLFEGRISFNGGNYVDIVTNKKDLYLTLKVRCHKVGNGIIEHSTNADLIMGIGFGIRISNYTICAEITKIGDIL